MKNLAGHALTSITFRCGRASYTFSVFVPTEEDARRYFARVVAPDWIEATGKAPALVSTRVC